MKNIPQPGVELPCVQSSCSAEEVWDHTCLPSVRGEAEGNSVLPRAQKWTAIECKILHLMRLHNEYTQRLSQTPLGFVTTMNEEWDVDSLYRHAPLR
jgi:hypothetical protein